MLLNCGVGEDSWESLGVQRDPSSPSKRKWVLNIHWMEEMSPEYSWDGLMLKPKLQYFGRWRGELSHLKRTWCRERLKAGGKGDNRGRDGWMASPIQWAWVWVNSGSWWQTGRPAVRPWGHKESDTTGRLNWHWKVLWPYLANLQSKYQKLPTISKSLHSIPDQSLCIYFRIQKYRKPWVKS